MLEERKARHILCEERVWPSVDPREAGSEHTGKGKGGFQLREPGGKAWGGKARGVSGDR